MGKTDIWYCRKLINGTWGQPVNCGNTINTEEEEAFPTIAGTGKLYFSSKGLPGMGGYDIFSTAGKTTSWTKPVNLKYPINTTTDDFWLTTEDGLTGYLSSNREGGKGSDDIYSFKPSRFIRSEALKPDTSRLFEPGKTFILKDIYYNLDKSDIRADAAVELDKLVVILRQNPGLKIELSSHTDSRASDTYNLALSRRRAVSAVNYLIMKGISEDRLAAKGYGELHLLNKCSDGAECSEQEHQLNRRTEIRIIDNTF
jgi:outer membrane protein OmpA-like peptidoglycan-associated protein